jgi:hypothetical protein
MKYLTIAILLIGTVSAIDLQSGENYNFECYNKTGLLSYDLINYTFYCADAEDCDFDYIDLVLNLNPGETLSNKKEQWNYTVSCGSANASQSICDLSRNIDPGDNLEYQTNTCNLDIECRECKESSCEDEIIEKNTDIEVDIRVFNNKARIQVGQWYRTLNLSQYENFSTSWQVEATCAGISSNETCTECGYEECQEFNVNGAFIADSFYKFADRVASESDKSNECTTSKAALEINNNQLNARVNELESNEIKLKRDLDNCTGTIDEMKLDYADLRQSKGFRTAFLWIFGVLFILSLGGNMLQMIITLRRPE